MEYVRLGVRRLALGVRAAWNKGGWCWECGWLGVRRLAMGVRAAGAENKGGWA